jgi:hypothetical protein
MKKKIVLVGASIICLILSGCIGSPNPNLGNGAENDDGGIPPVAADVDLGWVKTTEFQWVENGTCIGEKEQQQEQHIINDAVVDTRWNDTGNTRDNMSRLSNDGWYPTGNGNLYTREEEYRDYFSIGGSCEFVALRARWVDTGTMVMDVSESRDIVIDAGEPGTWYFIVEPKIRPVDIAFRVYVKEGKDLAVMTSHDLQNSYSTGAVDLPAGYTISIDLSYGGEVTVYVLDRLGYEHMGG